ncbi:kinase-like protein, partial [Imleria badia]
MWMSNGTLAEYINQDGIILSVSMRVQLITGMVAGLAYLHSRQVVHGDFHPGNILIDDKHNSRLTDFGLSQALNPVESPLSYLHTKSIRPGAVLFAAPELLHPELHPELQIEATLNSDVYSLGSIILFILSGKNPWNNRTEMESKLKEFNNPPPPVWPVIPDGVWDFIERCWSPRLPRNRPSAEEVLAFSTDKLEQLLQPNPASVVNVVLFGTLGCGKSSIINLLADEPIAQISTGIDVHPCTKRPRWYEISIGQRRFRLWDTMGFHFAREGDVSPLLPYEQALAVLRNLTDGANLILL